MNEKCDACGQRAEDRTCAGCGMTARIIDCGHYQQPATIAAGRVDGSDPDNNYCAECAEK